jgi:uncharacterized membrane protein
LRATGPSERRAFGKLWIAAACALIVAYTTLSHYCNTHAVHRLGALLSAGPLLAFGGAVLWRSVPTLIALSASVAAAALLYDCWPLFEKNFSMVYLLQECTMYGLLAFGFWRSLAAGNVALCTRLADQLHGPLSDAELRYTRRVTLAWAVFFTAITAVVVLLYLTAPRAVWSGFVNFVALPLVAAMFAAEYSVRRRVLPATFRSGILTTVRVFFASR